MQLSVGTCGVTVHVMTIYIKTVIYDIYTDWALDFKCTIICIKNKFDFQRRTITFDGWMDEN